MLLGLKDLFLRVSIQVCDVAMNSFYKNGDKGSANELQVVIPGLQTIQFISSLTAY